jgi:hypothetical protein
MNYVPNLGELCSDDAKRDAVHVAVAPVVAGHRLIPGHGVSLDKQGCAIREDSENFIGIVDPFLRKIVEEGEKFWLFLRPNTVTSLRHVWSHPAFTPTIPERKLP